MNRCLLHAAMGLVLAASGSVLANDWPSWRGPDGSGVSAETGWKVEGAPESLWTKEVGLGYSSFVVQGDHLLTVGHDKEAETDSIFCLDAKTGAERWTHTFPCKLYDLAHRGGALSTPTIDGERVYALNREGKLFCMQLADGRIIWQKNLMETDLGLVYPKWMFSASPLIDGSELILNVGRTVVFDKMTGAEKWRTARSTGDAYSTPHPITVKGRDCLAVFNSLGLAIIDRANGAELAFHEWITQYNINAATPIVIDDRIFISSGQNRGCAMLRFTGDALEVVWENKEMSNKMSGCVLWQGHLYGFDAAILKCIDLDGNEKWRRRGLGMGALMAADGKLILMSDKGELIVAEATPEAYTELSRERVLEGGVYWTMPVLANGLIYCRNSLGSVVCRDHRMTDG